MATLVRAPGDVPVHVKKVGRNEPCPCGSGKKAKNCNCGKAEQYFYLKSDLKRKNPHAPELSENKQNQEK